MKLFASICGLAALMTAAVNHRILGRFGAMYAELAQEPLPGLTRILVWNGGSFPSGLLLAGPAIVLTGLVKKNNRWMLAGGITSMMSMLGAATIVPAALMIPVSQMIQRMDKPHPPPPPAPAEASRDVNSIED